MPRCCAEKIPGVKRVLLGGLNITPHVAQNNQKVHR
jgi:hypothetical protein